jgi:hypothetical protein
VAAPPNHPSSWWFTDTAQLTRFARPTDLRAPRAWPCCPGFTLLIGFVGKVLFAAVALFKTRSKGDD